MIGSINQESNNGKVEAYEKLMDENPTIQSQSFKAMLIKFSTPLKINSKGKNKTLTIKSQVQISQ